MNQTFIAILVFLVLLNSRVDDESQPIGDLPFTPTSGIDTTRTVGSTLMDTSTVIIDSCYDRVSNLQTLGSCPPYVGGFLNGFNFSALADVTMPEQNSSRPYCYQHPLLSRWGLVCFRFSIDNEWRA